MSFEEKMIDSRLVHHHIRRQKLDPETFQKHLDGLEDCAEMGEPTVTHFAEHVSEPEGGEE